MPGLEVKINGTLYRFWHSCHIRKSMRSITGTVALMNTDIFRGNADEYKIKMGNNIKVFLDDVQVLDGYIEFMPIDYNELDATFEIHSRDFGDLVDCDFIATPNEWKNQKVSTIIKNLCSPFDVEVSVSSLVLAQANKIVPTYSVEDGKKVSEMINELCRDYQILPIAYGDGKLTLDSTRAKVSSDPIIRGENCSRMLQNLDDTNRFSSYNVKGQGNGSDNKVLTDWTECFGDFDDPGISRARPRTIFSETATDNGKCRSRAKWEARIAAGYSRSIYCEVFGWSQRNGALWEINTLVQAQDPMLEIQDTYLIDMIDYISNPEDGDRTYVYLVDKTTYDLSGSEIKIKTRFDN